MIWLLENWKLLVGAVSIGLLGLLLMFAKADARHWRKADEQHVQALNLEIAKNALQRASIDKLQQALTDQNVAVDKLAAESAASIKAGSDALAAARTGRQSAMSAAESLRASAGRVVTGEACAPSAAFQAVKGRL